MSEVDLDKLRKLRKMLETSTLKIFDEARLKDDPRLHIGDAMLPEAKTFIPDESPSDYGGLSIKEALVMRDLVEAWNSFREFGWDQINLNDLNDFRQAINVCQRILATQALIRHFPEGWNKK